MRVTINGRFVSQRATGVQRVQRECVRAIDRLMGRGRWDGVDVRLAVPQTPDLAHESLGLVHLPVDVVPGGAGQMWEQKAFAKAAKGSRLVCLGNTAPLLPMLRGQPTAVMVHDLAYRLFPEDYSKAYRAVHYALDAVILRKASPLLTVSATEREELLKSVPKGQEIVVAANGSCVDDVVPDVQHRAEGGTMLYVGAFSARKNIDRVLDVAVSVARQRGVGTVFVGPPNDAAKALEARIPTDVVPLVKFAGYVDEIELERLYRSATLLLYPSLYEASGLPPSEAMSYGCPVLSSDIPVMRERCADAAIFCDPHDVEAMVGAAIGIIDDPRIRNRLASAGRDRASFFTWEAQAETIMWSIIGTR